MVETVSPSVAIARDFLQTVLIVDDRAEFGAVVKLEPASADDILTDSPDGKDASAPSPQAKPPHEGLKAPTPAELSEAAGTDELNAKEIIDSFASLGLVCGVIRPEPDETITDIVGPAARRADILILDWRLDEDNGENSIELIRHVVADLDDCHRLRLIVIYTGVPDLEAIADRVARVLEGSVISRKNSLVAGPAHVTVLAKPDTPVDSDLHDAVVEFDELPDRVIAEFAKAIQGLLPNVALSSFAALRRNTHRMLKRFSQDLDAAYLGHRMLLRHPEDAEHLISDLMAQEIFAILDNAKVGESANSSAVESLVNESVLSARDIEPLKGIATRQGVAVADYAFSLVQRGIYDSAAGMSNNETDRAYKWTNKVYAVDDADASSTALRFAALVKSRSRYENPPPELRLGVFVKNSANDQFLLCMQPLCDSVRLSGDTQFPFLPLKPSEDKFDFVIEHLGTMHKLKLSLRIRDLQMLVFSPSANPPGAVKASRDDSSESGWLFTPSGTGTTSLLWVGELREGWAHKYANMFSDSISRVGMDDSEWARKFAQE